MTASGSHAPAFPAHPPASLADPAAIRDNDWQAFTAITHMDNHWDRPGWAPGRQSYHWFVTFAENPGVLELAQRCQQAFNGVPLNLVPFESLHMTVMRLAFTDEITPEEASAVAEAARARCEILAPLDVAVGPLAGSRGAIRFSVTPWHGLMELHRRLHAAASDVLGSQPPQHDDTFRPHLSIAYSNQTIPAHAVVPIVEQLRQLPVVETTVRKVRLVKLHREAQAYRWTIHATIPLLNAASVAAHHR